jgi:Matrixin
MVAASLPLLPWSGGDAIVMTAPAPAAPPLDWTRGTPAGTWSAASLPVVFTLDARDPRDLAGVLPAEVAVAIRAWAEAPCTAWRGVLAPARVLGLAAADDGVNAILWHDDVWPAELERGTLAQTVVHLDASGNVHDADIHVNGVDFRWSVDGAEGTIDARGVLVHEIGHALGLGHSSDPVATMYPSNARAIAWRSIEKDDRDGVCALYPGTASATCDTGAPCPSGFACVAARCARPATPFEVCSPCVREIGACAAAGEDARCVDIGRDPGGVARSVCGRACVEEGGASECGRGFRCLATTAAGDLQCVSDDRCGSGPAGDGGADGGDAGTGDAGAGADGPALGGGGCVIAGGQRAVRSVDAGAVPLYAGLMLLARARRRRRLGALGALGALAALATLSASACKPSEPAASANGQEQGLPTTGGDGGATSGSCRGLVARIDNLGVRRDPAKAPVATYVFDVTVSNPAAGPRWIVFPARFPMEGKDTPAPGKGSAISLTTDLLSGTGRIAMVHAEGTGGFRAMLLPGGAKVSLRQVPVVAAWTSSHATAKIEFILARDIRLDGEPLAKVVKGNLLSETDSDVSLLDDPKDSLVATKIFGKGSPNGEVELDEECRAVGQAVLKEQAP